MRSENLRKTLEAKNKGVFEESKPAFDAFCCALALLRFVFTENIVSSEPDFARRNGAHPIVGGVLATNKKRDEIIDFVPSKNCHDFTFSEKQYAQNKISLTFIFVKLILS